MAEVTGIKDTSLSLIGMYVSCNSYDILDL